MTSNTFHPEENLILIWLFRFSCLILFQSFLIWWFYNRNLSYSSSFCWYLGLFSVQHTKLKKSLMSMELVRSGSKQVQLAKTEYSWKTAVLYLSRPSSVECLVSEETTTSPDKGRGTYYPVRAASVGKGDRCWCQMALTSIGLVSKRDCLKYLKDPISRSIQFTSDSSPRQTV